MAKTKMGRPTLDPSGPQDRLLQIRLSDTQRESYERAASVAEMKLSVWIRDCLDKAAVKTLRGR